MCENFSRRQFRRILIFFRAHMHAYRSIGWRNGCRRAKGIYVRAERSLRQQPVPKRRKANGAGSKAAGRVERGAWPPSSPASFCRSVAHERHHGLQHRLVWRAEKAVVQAWATAVLHDQSPEPFRGVRVHTCKNQPSTCQASADLHVLGSGGRGQVRCGTEAGHARRLFGGSHSVAAAQKGPETR